MTPKPSTWVARYTWNKPQCHTFEREHPRKAIGTSVTDVKARYGRRCTPVEAEAAYARSREAMIGNLGSRLSINRVVREVAAEQEADLVDLRKIFDDYQHRRQRHFNTELIHDDCHPTPLGHALIAQHLEQLLGGVRPTEPSESPAAARRRPASR